MMKNFQITEQLSIDQLLQASTNLKWLVFFCVICFLGTGILGVVYIT